MSKESLTEVESASMKASYMLHLPSLKSGRLKEHIASKHPDEQQVDTPAAPPNIPTPRLQPAQGSGTKAAHPAAVALVAAANAAAADTSGPVAPVAAKRAAAAATPLPPSGSPGAAANGPAATTETSSQVKVSIMDVGSRAGYYTHKSPKLQLLEWTQAKKMQKPRYSAKLQENGLYTCKVSTVQSNLTGL
jgi:hypothetical protein